MLGILSVDKSASADRAAPKSMHKERTVIDTSKKRVVSRAEPPWGSGAIIR